MNLLADGREHSFLGKTLDDNGRKAYNGYA